MTLKSCCLAHVAKFDASPAFCVTCGAHLVKQGAGWVEVSDLPARSHEPGHLVVRLSNSQVALLAAATSLSGSSQMGSRSQEKDVLARADSFLAVAAEGAGVTDRSQSRVVDGVCEECAALVGDPQVHDRWHDELLARINKIADDARRYVPPPTYGGRS